MKRTIKVLVVEDDLWFAEQQQRTLEEAGFTVRHAKDGIAAIEVIDEELPDAIVLDVFLPGPNALVLLHEIQSYTDLSKVPVIICSGSAADVPQNNLKAYGVVSVLDKSLMQPADLVAAIRRAVL